MKLGNSNNLVIGEWAIAIGNPFGFYLGNSEPSVSVGVISATQRNLVAPGEGQASYFDMIQTDAAINPGNSGGPLVNADGEVIGVNSSIFSPSGGSVGLGFAIPINRVARVVDDLIDARNDPQPVDRRAPQTSGSRRIRATRRPSGRDRRDGDAWLTRRSGRTSAGRRDPSRRQRARSQPFDWSAALLDLRVGRRLGSTSNAARANSTSTSTSRICRKSTRRKFRCSASSSS